MIQAILLGVKTQTRRVIKAQSEANNYFNIKGLHVPIEKMSRYCPYGQVGDRLWVKRHSNIMQTNGMVQNGSPVLHIRQGM